MAKGYSGIINIRQLTSGQLAGISGCQSQGLALHGMVWLMQSLKSCKSDEKS